MVRYGDHACSGGASTSAGKHRLIRFEAWMVLMSRESKMGLKATSRLTSLPFMPVIAASASSELANWTKPMPLESPEGSRSTLAFSTSPNSCRTTQKGSLLYIMRQTFCLGTARPSWEAGIKAWARGARDDVVLSGGLGSTSKRF